MLYDGVQVSMRITIVKSEADNWILHLGSRLTCRILACKFHSREAGGVGVPIGNARYVGIRCK